LTDWENNRRESEIDDHGEMYPPTWEGPDLYVFFSIPRGAYALSLYVFNPNGHEGTNRDRDFVISALRVPAGSALRVRQRADVPISLIAPLAKVHAVVRCRSAFLRGGIWKRFLVRGPMHLAVRVARNYSLNAILSGAMLDLPAEHPAPYYYGHKAWLTRRKRKRDLRLNLLSLLNTGDHALSNATAGGGIGPVSSFFLQLLETTEHCNPCEWKKVSHLGYTLVLRACLARRARNLVRPNMAGIVESCYYRLGLFRRWERAEVSRGLSTSREMEERLRWNPVTAFLSVSGYRTIRSRVTGQLRPR
jgi:hypothetical protein